MLEIRSFGPPPERYADRVVAEMMRELARKHATLWDEISAVVTACGGAGTPKAQRKLAQRIERAGAYHTVLNPGKRGRFDIMIYDFTGYDPGRDEEIRPGDPICPKPWIACNLSAVESQGGGHNKIQAHSRPLLFITCHAMSRVAQRLGARNADHLMKATRLIWNTCLKFINDGADATAWFNAPPAGWRVSLPTIDGKSWAVLKRNEKRTALVCTTVITEDEHAPE